MTDLRNTDADQEAESDAMLDVLAIVLKLVSIGVILFFLWVMK